MFYFVHTQNEQGWLRILKTRTDFGKAWYMQLVGSFIIWRELIHFLFPVLQVGVESTFDEAQLD